MRALSLLLLLTQIAPAQKLLLRPPTLNQTHIVFSFANDLWSVPKDGGAATRLTSGVGNESTPIFSPDGATIAFTGEYDGNVDVFTIPANLSGLPALSVPAGMDGALPVGIHLVGAPLAEGLLLELARRLERSTGLAHRVAQP
jgi:hypothetical protein